MGAQQSTSTDSAASAKTGYYTLLGVERAATEAEIKKAYRKLALACHPDRNIGREEWATAQFTEIQAAYEVLSDPHERAWYDAHEATILRGGDPADPDDPAGAGAAPNEYSVPVTPAADVSAVMGLFRAQVDFSDGPDGFYGFLRAFFGRLADEERQVAAAAGLAFDPATLPPFGHAGSAFGAVVKPFYAAWAGFATVKPFAWKDRHRTRDLPDRATRRHYEKENKKARDGAVREFNAAVVMLVRFVRKRDPRWAENVVSEQDRHRAQREASAKQAARERARNRERLDREVEQSGGGWAAPDSDAELGAEWDDPGSDSESEAEEREVLEYECVACQKSFKSANQFGAHEKSKKHQRAVFQLCRQLEKEEKLFGIGGRSGSAEQPAGGGGGSGSGSGSDGEGAQPDEGGYVLLDDHGDEGAAELDRPVSTAGLDPGGDDDRDAEDESEDAEDEPLTDTDAAVVAEKLGSLGLGAAAQDPVGRGPARSDAGSPRLTPSPSPAPAQPAEPDEPESPPRKKGAKAARRRKQQRSLETAAAAAKAGAPEPAAVCGVCKDSFPSRTQLFRHVEQLGHALPKKDVPDPPRKGAKRGKNK